MVGGDNRRKRVLRGGQEAAEVDKRRAGGAVGDGGLSALPVPLLLQEAHITVMPSSPCLLRSIQTVSVPVSSHQGGEKPMRGETERMEREKDQFCERKITKSPV